MEEKIQKLSEGMDFLEEACGYGEPLEFTEAEEGVIFEANGSKPSPYKVLGRCSGVFQPIGEYSRNKRIYSSDLWPTILEGEELKSRLAHRAVFGCLGHADKLVDDRDIQEGKVSHIVTVLEVREDQKTHKPFLYGELEILDTPAGRILEAMYKGGANLYVSSRAAGRLTPIPGDPENRMLVSPSNYCFHCFDIVARPGFLQAKPAFEAVSTEVPQLHESAQEGVQVPSQVTLASTTASEAQDISTIKSQLDKLAKIVEKVVDDVYEEPTSEAQEKPEEKVLEKKPAESKQMQEQPIAPVDKKEKANESLVDFVSLMASTNISEEAFEEIIDMIANAKGIQK